LITDGIKGRDYNSFAVASVRKGRSVIERGPTTEDEMVVAFLQAELSSSRYERHIRKGLADLGAKSRVIEQPNLADQLENDMRRWLLSYRGYPLRAGLFTNFPHDVQWRRVELDLADLRDLRYIRHPNWTNLSNGTRLVQDGALSVREHSSDPRFEQIVGIAEGIRNGVCFPALIAVQNESDYLVLVEGHSRATAYVFESFGETVEAFVGSSASMKDWPFY